MIVSLVGRMTYGSASCSLPICVTSNSSGVPHIPRPWFAYFDADSGQPKKISIGSQGRGMWRFTVNPLPDIIIQSTALTAESCVPAPLDVSTGPVFLTLFGTGLRNRSSLENVSASIGGVDVPVLFAGAGGGFPALDQVNVQVPASLRGRGALSVVVTVDGQNTNPVTISVQ